MRTRARPIALALVAVTLAGLVPSAPAASLSDPPHFVVGFHGSPPDVADLAGGRVVGRSDALAFLVVEGLDPAAARLDPRVRYVEREPLRKLIEATPNDAQYSSQYAPQEVRLPLAWDVTMGSTSASVCVVDTGARLTHQDLAASRYHGGYDFVQNDATPQDGHGHGTHVLGIAAASVNNALNIAGAGNVGYHVARVLDDAGEGYFSTVAQGIQWCVDRPDARVVISLSLGCGAGSLDVVPLHGSGENCDSQPVRDAISNAFAAGRLVVVAAGNDGGCYSCVSFPARIPGVLAVGCNYQQYACIFSSWGNEVSLVAPGDSILSLGIASDTSTAYMSGTSMSTPLVAGAAALYWSHDNGISMTALRDRVRRSAVDQQDPGWDSISGCGRLDVKRLFDGTLSTCSLPSFPPCATTPANDCFANALQLPHHTGNLLVSNAAAGDEPDEVHPCEVGNAVWYKFTASTSEVAWVYTWNSPPRTSVAIYKAGTSLTDLVGQGCSDGYPTPSGPANVEFNCIAGTTYYMQVGGNWGERGTIDIDLDLCKIGPEIPYAPGDFRALGNGAIGSVALSWIAPWSDGGSAITSYHIERAPAPTGTCPSSGFETIAVLDGTARTAQDDAAPPSTTACYRIVAVNAVGNGDAARATVFVPGLPSPPRVPTATGAVGENRLAWFAPFHWGGTTPVGFRVYAASGSAGPFDLLASLPPSNRSYNDSLPAGTTRYYRLTSVNALGESAPTATLTARTASAPHVPRTVTAGPGLVPFSVHVAWQAPGSNGGSAVTAYEIFRDGEFHDRVDGSARAYEDVDLGPFEHHEYAVRALNLVGAGPTSRDVCGEAFEWPDALSPGCA